MCSTRQRLAAVLREHRVSRGLTLRHAAEQAMLAPSTLSRWESGASIPRVFELESLLRSFGVSEEHIKGILMSIDAPRAVRAVRTHDRSAKAELLAPSGGNLLKALRSRAKLSVGSVADMLRVSPSTLSRWESGHARPGQDVLERLLELLGASDEVRQCLCASGVAKLKAERPPYDRHRYEEELETIEKCVLPSLDRELRLLQMQSQLWWFRELPGALDLLKRAYVCYAETLASERRFAEATEQGQAVISAGVDPHSSLGIRAYRALARSEVYRWPKPRPHIGLYLLQSCHDQCSDPFGDSAILRDMAEYSRLAGRESEACSYAERAERPMLTANSAC